MIGVLVSGEGTNLQALIDASLPIVAVASNKAGVRALERAESAGIATAIFELDDYPDREARDGAMAEWLSAIVTPSAVLMKPRGTCCSSISGRRLAVSSLSEFESNTAHLDVNPTNAAKSTRISA